MENNAITIKLQNVYHETFLKNLSSLSFIANANITATYDGKNIKIPLNNIDIFKFKQAVSYSYS